MQPAVLTERLTKRYGLRIGIDSLDLEIGRRSLGFIGPTARARRLPSGCWLDLIHPTGGRAQVLGLDCHKDSVPSAGRWAICRAISASTPA